MSLVDYALEVAAVTDVGSARDHNEDACTTFVDTESCAVAIVADGVSGSSAGEVASELACEAVVRAYREDAGAPGQRLYRAFQQANIEIYDKAITVPELRGMATTLTAAVIDHGELTAVHVGDSRLYLVRDGVAEQLTADHTLLADKQRFGLVNRDRARDHPDKSVLTRSVGRELIVSRDRLRRRVVQGDVVVLCTDGLHNVLGDDDIGRIAATGTALEAARALVDAANARGTPDNLSAGVMRLIGPTPEAPEADGLGVRLKKLLRMG